MRLLLVFAILLPSCRFHHDHSDLRAAVLNTDLDFSACSQRMGMKKAFLLYMDTNAVMLKPNHMPIIGNAARAYLQQAIDTGYVLTWQPQFSEAAASADLAYTYGTYTLKTKDTVLHGTYVSVWKCDNAGHWKYVLDSGNPGLGQ